MNNKKSALHTGGGPSFWPQGGTDLQGVDLQGADLQSVYLQGADFMGWGIAGYSWKLCVGKSNKPKTDNVS